MEDKENIQQKFMEMIKESWTWAKLTEEEKEDFENRCLPRAVLTGNFTQRWQHLNDMYWAFLVGIGYTNYYWREEE